MKFETKTVRRTINKAFLKEPLERDSFTQFKEALEQLLSDVELAKEKNEHEEHFKNFLVPFFNKAGFGDYSINTSGRIDMAIHTGGKGKDPVGVLIEAKRPGNAAEMITAEQLNRKAMHEAVLYYLEQRIEQNNSDLKHVIITNMDDWFIFDAQEFERVFYSPSTLRNTWKEWKSDRKVSSNNDFMYGEISKFMDSQDAALSGLWLPLDKTRKFLKGKKDSDYEKKLIPICKLFTPTHLLKEPFANDSNSLNREFYRELLYILGLEETKEGSTRYIQRASEKNRNPGSIIENTIRILDAEDHLSTLKNELSSYGSSRGEQLFSVAMELSITWMNRILFLKLLEAQLYRYHRQDNKFKFLNYRLIDSLDELNKLFFQVLARKEKDRLEDVNEKFGHIPYLNSSLFDVSDLEHQTTRISGLDDHARMPVYSRSVLTKERGSNLNTLDYLFRFLEAYDFSAEGSEEIRDERKSLINASVLGLIFEKINGYKDGSFYTPGFITEYMARETLRKAVVDRFRALTPTPLPGGEGLHSEGQRGMSSSEPWKKLPDSLLENARYLRQNQTDAEEVLWQLVRNKQLNGIKFRRQHPIEEGFILDFYCHEKKLAIEVDGDIHDRKDQKASDAERTQILNDLDIQVIRFSNDQILEETEDVLIEIFKTAHEPNSPPSPRGRGAGGEGAGGRGVPEGRGEGELTFTDIYNRIGRDISIEQANHLINSITICDPAVGSGHFLVSCLNELIAIKSELGILCDEDGKVLRGVDIEVQNDELIISYGEELFEYDVSHQWNGQRLKSRKVAPDKQRIQKTLFREKKHLIENCLFGVDINPNSVKICRLRLWIELLKRAYYQLDPPSPRPSGDGHPSPSGRGAGPACAEASEGRGEGGSAGGPHSGSLPGGERTCGSLEVLPNIDINIKQGNSLVSRFGLDADLSTVFKNSEHSLEDYKEAVRSYKHTGDSTEKKRLYALIDDIKNEYSTTLYNNNPVNKKLSRERGRLELMQSDDLFGEVKFTKKQVAVQKKKVKKLEQQKADEESGAFYNQAFEWRFEFPEVLDDEGRFTGFDVVIGNPPYIFGRESFDKAFKSYLKTHYETSQYQLDLYVAFLELGVKVLKEGAYISYITPNSWLKNLMFTQCRKFLLDNTDFYRMVPYLHNVFEDANVDSLIFITRKSEKNGFVLIDDFTNSKIEFHHKVDQNRFYGNHKFIFDAHVTESVKKILQKIEDNAINLEELFEITRGVNAYDSYRGQSKEVIKNRAYHSDHQKNDTYVPELKGKHVVPFHYNWSGDTYISYGDWLAAPRDPKFFIGERIILRQVTGDRLRCSFIDEKFITDQTVFIAKPIENKTCTVLPKYLVAVFSSLVYSFYFRYTLSEFDDLFPKVKIGEFRVFPIKLVPIEHQRNLASKLDQIISAKKQNPEADTSELEGEIDRLVYKLYGLSEEEIEVVEGG